MAKAVQVKRGRLTKKELEAKKLIAEIMFMGFEDQNMIAETIGVTAKTIGEWKTAGSWERKRSAKTISRDELVNKLLSNINIMLDEALEEDNEDRNFASLADQLIKMTNAIEKLDKKNNVVNDIEAFTRFNKHLLQKMAGDKNIMPDLVKQINKLQNDYVTFRMAAQ